MSLAKILIVEDDTSSRKAMDFILREAGYEVQSAAGGLQGYELFTQAPSDLVITDLAMPEMDGLQLTERIKLIFPEIPVIVITAFGEIQTAVSAIKLGAEDYLTKPLDWNLLMLAIQRALKIKNLVSENRKLKIFIGEKFKFGNLVGNSQCMQELYAILQKIAPTDVSVVLLGKSGTGKELIAKSLHHHSSRKEKPFVIINCGALPENLLESELFGHRKGSFTGAIYDKKGLFQEANGGTLFLDEIGEMPLTIQVKFLRVLQEGECLRLGDNVPQKVNVRIIAATHRDLKKMVGEGTFREDLYFRLSVIPVRIPSLQERKEDIPLLANEFLKEFSQRHQRPELQFVPEIYQKFHNYSWPGNVRELRNTVERMVVLTTKNRMSAEELPQEIREFQPDTLNSFHLSLPEGGLDLEEVEKEILRLALEKHQYNQTHTAQYLNITRNTLIYRMQKFNLG
ncbi:sigma-54 dependent transcriptional regulator [Deltaproteobacteria bacterium TL4]